MEKWKVDRWRWEGGEGMERKTGGDGKKQARHLRKLPQLKKK